MINGVILEVSDFSTAVSLKGPQSFFSPTRKSSPKCPPPMQVKRYGFVISPFFGSQWVFPKKISIHLKVWHIFWSKLEVSVFWLDYHRHSVDELYIYLQKHLVVKIGWCSGHAINLAYSFFLLCIFFSFYILPLLDIYVYKGFFFPAVQR